MKGFGSKLSKLLCSYLADRSQTVNIKGKKPMAVGVSSRMPQGSILNQILFALFINDIFLVVRFCKILGFADDTKLFHTICCIEDAMDMQLDLTALYNWSLRNRLSLNIVKCAVLSYYRERGFFDTRYTMNDEDLKRVTVMKDLGVIFIADLEGGGQISGEI